MFDLQKKNAALLNESLDSSQSLNNVQLPTITIASTFRLMASLERQNVLELSDYLGLPVLSIKKDELYKYGNMFDQSAGNSWLNKFKNNLNDEERRIICDSLFYITNWFIELVNAFAPLITFNAYNDSCPAQEDKLIKKILLRLNTIYDLQMILLNILPHMNYYKPPMSVFGLVDFSSEDWPFVHTLFKKKEAKKKKAKASIKRKTKQNIDKKAVKKKKSNFFS